MTRALPLSDRVRRLKYIVLWEAEIGGLDIDGGKPILIYDDGRPTEAARVWFIFQHFGAPATVIDGGWPHLAALPQDAGDGGLPRVAAFRARLDHTRAGLAGRAEVLDDLDGSARIFDARIEAEYAGQDRRKTRGARASSWSHPLAAHAFDWTGWTPAFAPTLLTLP